jgi:CobQ-like glutamine amidotransferase family enzyme
MAINWKPFGQVLLGKDYLWEKGYEGFVYKGFLGTQLRGPILPRNYDLCDYLISQMTNMMLPKIPSSLEKSAKARLNQESHVFIESGEQKKEYNYVS